MKFDKKVVYSKNNLIKFPYILYVPNKIAKNASLIVDIKTPNPMNGNINDIINTLLDEESSISYNPYMLLKEFNYPVMTPIIPRINGFYTTFLGSKIIKNDFTDILNKYNEEELELFKNIDLQVYYMIKEANDILGISEKAIINGYSAGAKFATGFSILHPDIICCNFSGGTSGLSTLPTKEILGIKLPFPIGINDINFDEVNYKKIKHFFYIAEDDYNNPALPLSEMSNDYDESGNLKPIPNTYKKDMDGGLFPYYTECYSKEEINIIDKIYGHENLKRFKINEKYYKDLGINSIHKIYKGNHSNIFKLNREEIIKEMINIINSINL